MSLIPGTLPSGACYGTPQELLDLFAQYLDIPAFAVSSKVIYSATSPMPNTDFVWVDTTGSTTPVFKLYNEIIGDYQEYPFQGQLSPAGAETLISGKTAITTLASSDLFLVSQAGTSAVLKKITWANVATQIPAGTITFSMLSAQVNTDPDTSTNVKSRLLKAYTTGNNGGTINPTNTFGFSSVTDGGVGLLQFNYNFTATTNAVAVGTNYASGAMGGIEIAGQSTAAVSFQSRNSAGSAQDCSVNVMVVEF